MDLGNGTCTAGAQINSPGRGLGEDWGCPGEERGMVGGGGR